MNGPESMMSSRLVRRSASSFSRSSSSVETVSRPEMSLSPKRPSICVRRHSSPALVTCERTLKLRVGGTTTPSRSEEHTSELQSLMRISYAVFCLKKKKKTKTGVNSTYTLVRKATAHIPSHNNYSKIHNETLTSHTRTQSKIHMT